MPNRQLLNSVQLDFDRSVNGLGALDFCNALEHKIARTFGNELHPQQLCVVKGESFRERRMNIRIGLKRMNQCALTIYYLTVTTTLIDPANASG